MKNPYINCPKFETNSFLIRLVSEKDSEGLFHCYHDKTAVQFMNDDNCDFGFYVDSQDKMLETIKYWVEFYKQQAFIRFSVIDKMTGEAVGTIEGFAGETGVLRVDLRKEFEKENYLSEIFIFAHTNFFDLFGNKNLVTKAIEEAVQRRAALMSCGWEFIDSYKTFKGYYRIIL